MLLFLVTALANPCADVIPGAYVPATPIGFVPRAADLTEATTPAVAELACALTQDPSRVLHIGVHTDSMGSGTYNLTLSQQRADALRTALVTAGIAPDRITARGYGEDYPVTSNATAEGREQNRRVELLTADPKRPEAAAPVAPSPVAPVAPPSLCARVKAALPGSSDVESALAPAQAAAELQTCLGATATADGAEWYLTHGADTLVIRPAAKGSIVHFTR